MSVVELNLLAREGYAYFGLLRRIHEEIKPRGYIEIGVRTGASLALASPETIAVGVDPAADVPDDLAQRAKLFNETSDAFFDRHDVGEVLEGAPLDLAFIDGMHLFEFALRDFINLERHCHPESIVLVHDCLPIDKASAARECETFMWSGDVWKLIVCLKKYRPDLDIATVDVSPTGLGIIRGLNAASTVLSDQLDDLCAEFITMDYDDVLRDEHAKRTSLNCVDDNWRSVLGALGRSAST